MKTQTLTAPSAWASAIVNGDYSSLDAAEIKAVNTFLALNSAAFSDCISCEPAGFVRRHDAFAQWPYAAECEVYTFPSR